MRIRACLFFAAALLTAAESLQVLKQQGAALKANGDAQAALARYQAALQISPTSPELHDEVGFLLTVLQRRSEGREHLRRAVSLGPRYAPAHYHLGVMEWLDGNRDA